MTVELKIFGGALFAKDKALKENPELKKLAIFVNAPNKSAAEAIIAGKVAEHYPANMSDYFKAKVWEHREGLPHVEPGAFSTDFFETVAVWNATANEPAAAQPASDEKGEWEDNAAAEELKTVSKLDLHSRAACLALFGPVADINKAQYNKVVDLINIDNGSFQYQLAQAFVKEPRALALSAERQEEMLAWVRKTMLVSTLCPDIKKALTEWIDTAPDKRPQTTDATAAMLGGGKPTDRSADIAHDLNTLRLEVALGIIGTAMDFDIYAIPSEILRRAKELDNKGSDPRFTAWWKQFRRTPGVLDFSRAVIIALIKAAPEDLYLKPFELRAYIDNKLTESDHTNPDQATIAIACGTATGEQKNDEAKQNVPGETLPHPGNHKSDEELNAEVDALLAQRAPDDHIAQQLAAERGEFVPGVSDPAHEKWVDGSAQPVIEKLVDSRPQVVNFSGGRTSAYLVHLMEQRRKAGENIRYVFMDTGAEHPKTYEFIRNVVKTWNIPLVCLRVVVNPDLGGANSYREVDIDELAPDLQPWRDISRKYGLPYFAGPFCTRAMKTNVFGYYCRDKFGKDGYHSWLGIRADEPKRLKKRKDVSYLADISPIEKQDILNWWKEQPFDLGIPEHLGNCVFCIKKGVNKLALAARDEPELAKDFWELAIDPSNRVVESRKHPNKFMFRQAHSLESIIALFSEHSREDITATIRGGGGYETESCTEGCEIDTDELDPSTHIELHQASEITLDAHPEQKKAEAYFSYRQQLTVAALQGMCANPAYRGDFDDLPNMAIMLEDGILKQECI